ncbi:GCG_CRPN prefix-to-repeats domain-containing protein [Methylobacterium frigidaeris]|uniref:Sulfur globule protein n=1 Tax=Methylobacterium frigidaeris TaxID=2038277 RepID=A0AA37M2M2_9HYPH|nr:hypothetical protein [Methylobacterium frigidaeris]PIK70928.1 hypothetical protein CS379_22055 [Methylobacterium frigidaeris]GJD60743.1 hypothetical protein MPEAHAMD_0882 [Methylobacterium frigidaeris]
MLMRWKIVGLAALAFGGLAAAPANAAPAGPGLTGLTGLLAPEAPVTQVAQGCGPGFARGPYGRCRPIYGRRFYGPPRVYGRRCFVRPTPYGPRRICRF